MFQYLKHPVNFSIFSRLSEENQTAKINKTKFRMAKACV